MREIETPRLRLRQFTCDDLDDLYRLYNSPDLMRYIGKGIRTKNETQTALSSIIKHYEHGFGMWAVISKDDDKLIGRCGLCFLDHTPEVELGYLLDKSYWRKGLATEASHASLKYGFEVVKLDKIVAIAKPENIASRRVMEKVGMKYEKDAYFYNNDVVYYAISRDIYQMI
ncbi:MAG: GNAT family N-acetyltransferase [Coleofasciculaceae cyanobacterium]